MSATKTPAEIDCYLKDKITELTKLERAQRLDVERCGKRLSEMVAEQSKTKSKLEALECAYNLLKKDEVI